MNKKESIRKFQRSLARNGLYFSYWILKLLPYDAMRSFATVLLSIGFKLTGKHRRVAKESLQIAFGHEKTPEQIDAIIRRNFNNLGRGMIELLYFMSHKNMVDGKFFFKGREHLDEALKRGKGVIAVSAHFGNFPIMMLFAAQQGYKANVIMRPTRDEELEKYLYRKRAENGLMTIYTVPRKKCVIDSLRVLRNNEILFVLLDQNFGGDGGVYVDFFGQKAATATGPFVLARRTDSVILPMFIIRQPDDTHHIVIEPPFDIEEKATEDETLLYNTARITKVIEGYIRRYPYEWGWMHRRWKTRPPDEQGPAQESA